MKRTLVLEGEQPPSWNEFYSGKHWSIRTEKARRAHALVRASLDPELPPFTRPVTITGIAYFAKQPQDPSNICLKIYEDGLIGWWIVDDGPLYVRSVTTISRIDRARPRLEIEVEEIPEHVPDIGPYMGGLKFACTCTRKYTQLAQLLEHRQSGECNDTDGGRVRD